MERKRNTIILCYGIIHPKLIKSSHAIYSDKITLMDSNWISLVHNKIMLKSRKTLARGKYTTQRVVYWNIHVGMSLNENAIRKYSANGINIKHNKIYVLQNYVRLQW